MPCAICLAPADVGATITNHQGQQEPLCAGCDEQIRHDEAGDQDGKCDSCDRRCCVC